MQKYLLLTLLIVSPLMGQEKTEETKNKPRGFYKVGVSTRIEYTQISPIRYLEELQPMNFAEANTVRNVTVFELMLGKTDSLYFYAQGRFSSFFPYNRSFEYIGTGQISGGLLLGLGGKIHENNNLNIYVNWGLVYDSKMIDTFANYPYFDNEVNFNFVRDLNDSNSKFTFSMYAGFGVTRFDDGGDPDSIVTLRGGMGLGFLF